MRKNIIKREEQTFDAIAIEEQYSEEVKDKMNDVNKRLKSEVMTMRGAKKLLEHEKKNKEKYGNR